MRYRVQYETLVTKVAIVEAESEEEALRLVSEGKNEYESEVYSEGFHVEDIMEWN